MSKKSSTAEKMKPSEREVVRLSDVVKLVELTKFRPNPWNRKHVDDGDFKRLVKSVRVKGVLIPIFARPVEPTKDKPEPYEIIYGERRWRGALKVAGKKADEYKIHTIIRVLTDDEAFDLTTIENLIRRNLTALEEAKYFRGYFDRHGDGAVEDLAHRCGITAGYIRRRIRFTDLPKAVLEAHEKGEIKIGHMEQLVRLLPDKKLIDDYFRYCTDEWDQWTVKELRDSINDRAVKLSGAKFDLEEAGCRKCAQNTQVQAGLLDDLSALAEECCQNASCFKDHQRVWLKTNWPQYGKTHKTKSFYFEGELAHGDHHDFDKQHAPAAACFECLQFVSIVKTNGQFEVKQSCTGKRECFTRAYKSKELAKERELKRKTIAPAAPSGTKQENDSPRNQTAPSGSAVNTPTQVPTPEPKEIRIGPNPKRAEEFRESFYKERIPAVMGEIEGDDTRSGRIILAALLHANSTVKETFARKHGILQERRYGVVANKDVWMLIEQMNGGAVYLALRDAATEVILQAYTHCGGSNFGAVARHLVALHLGIDLQTEWRITEEYLDKNTISEMLGMGEMLGIFQDKKAQAFLEETLLKRQGKFGTCSKKELKRVFLESGVDLAGKVPPEILRVDGISTLPDPNAPPVLNEFGCDEVFDEFGECSHFSKNEVAEACTSGYDCCRQCDDVTCEFRCEKSKLNEYGCTHALSSVGECTRLLEINESAEEIANKCKQNFPCCKVCDGNRDCEIRCKHVRVCRVCGCTDHCACPGGCSWVEKDLCSSCVGKG